jgi:hypothetical protein
MIFVKYHIYVATYLVISLEKTCQQKTLGIRR